MRGIKLAVLFLAVAFASAAQAFTISARSENSLVPESALRAATQQAAAAVGNRIPDDPNVKVTVFTRAEPSKAVAGGYLYLHRIELRRAFNAGAPYPFAGWLPIHTVERYGDGSDKQTRDALDQALRDFFSDLKNIDPAVGIK